MTKSKITLASPRGFCAGVDRAITIVEKVLEIKGTPVYVRNEVVHNKFVVNQLKEKGAIFIEKIAQVPDNCVVIFSAHGVSKNVVQQAKNKNLEIFDATCPLVTKVHNEVIRYAKNNFEVILIGHKGHPEVEGTMGQYSNEKAGIYLVENTNCIQNLEIKNPNKLALVTQTTLSVDDSKDIILELKNKYPNINTPKKSDICYATQNRQNATKKLAKNCDIIFVVGSTNSSNSNRLKELAQKHKVNSFLIDNYREIDINLIKGKKNIGVTAGASAPDILVQQVIDKLKQATDFDVVELKDCEETIHFALPDEIRKREKGNN